MALPTISSVVAQMSTLVDTWQGYTSQLRAWLAGTTSGGPGSDGSYPLTDDKGNTFLVPSPAAQAARVDAVVNSAQSYATAADSSAAAAATSAMNAGASETASAAHRDDAQTSASTAEMYATAAGNSAADALSSKTASTASASASSASASAAAQSATDAQTSATDAAASASTATSQAASAASSANDAYASALTAQTAVTGLLRYAGSYDASTGVFPANPSKGDFWKIGTAGTVGGVDLAVGDQIIWSGSGWDKIDNTESVTSVAGRVGAVTLSIPDISGLQTTLDGKATSAQGAKADTAVQPGQSLNLTAADDQIILSSPGQRQIGIVSTQTPRVGFYDITNSKWLVKIEADNSTTFAGSVAFAENLVSATNNVVLGTTGSTGGVFLRPSGVGSTTGEFVVSVGGVRWGTYGLWHAGNFDPATKANANNAALTGTVTIPGIGTNTFSQGTSDAASYTGYNVKWQLWYGLGMATYDGSINGFYDARVGRWDTKGGYRVNGQDVWHAGNFDPAAKLGTNIGVGLDHNNAWLGVADIPGSGAYGLFVDTNNNVIMTYNWQHKLSVGAGGVFIDDAAVWHAGNLNPASFATAAQGTKADAALPAANLSGFTKFAVVTALPGSPDPNTIYFVT